jgi:hypothetical protein
VFENHYANPDLSKSEGPNLTRYYLERLSLLRRTGAEEDSPEIIDLYREIAELPVEKSARLISLLNLGDDFLAGVRRAHQEMDPLEDPQRFAERAKVLAQRVNDTRD